MNTRCKKLFSMILCAVLVFSLTLPAFADEPVFASEAYASILTGSDFQDVCTKAYDRFGRVLGLMKADGLPTPDSMLVGGDYTKVLFDYAVPGISQIRSNLVAVYPDADPDAVVCIQGNHDNPSSGFVKNGLYDMGAYNLYVINEDYFPYLQPLRPGAGCIVNDAANELKNSLNELIEVGDLRPVIVMTHLPLHHTTRTLYGENMFASYIFDVLNEVGKTLDLIFLFGHQHSGDYDDYIGGSVNFMRPGDTLRVPKTGEIAKNAYREEPLTFTYANYGYMGYSDNNVTETSTNVLTLGLIQITDASFHFVKYTEDGFYKSWDVTRKNTVGAKERIGAPTLTNRELWEIEQRIFERFFAVFRKLIEMFS